MLKADGFQVRITAQHVALSMRGSEGNNVIKWVNELGARISQKKEEKEKR